MSPHEIAEIKSLLEQMQREDTEFRVFGSEQHRYLLGPALTEADLATFERTHEIQLPGDYRTFLAEVGNGGIRPSASRSLEASGAGPHYGLFSLNDAASYSALNQICPLTDALKEMSEEELNNAIDPDKYPGVPGALTLCHGGCGIFYYLVVNGPEYGTIWEGREDFNPVAKSFRSWYKMWTEMLTKHALPRLASEQSIKHIRLGMTKAEIIAICGGEWEQHKYRETSNLAFKHLSTEFKLNENDVLIRIIDHCI